MVTLNQLVTIAQANLSTVKNWKYSRDLQGDTIYYKVSDTKTKKFIGMYYVRLWTDGTIRAGWAGERHKSGKISELRDKFHLEMILPQINAIEKKQPHEPLPGISGNSNPKKIEGVRLDHTSGDVQPGISAKSDASVDKKKTIFVIIPKASGRFILDILGRDRATDRTAVILGYIIIAICIAVAFRVIKPDALVGLFKYE